MVTIYDIAKKCNCSYTTVSKVFNNTGAISEKKKQEIFAAAKELGYIPNSTARSLATKKSHIIGVILHNFEDRGITHELFSRILNSFRIEAEKNGYDILLISQNHESYLMSCKSRAIDGVFVMCCDYSLEKSKELINGEIPFVCFDNNDVPNSVQSDNKEAIAKMVDYLVSKGHRNIMYINPDDNAPVTRSRLEGYKLGLERNNIEFDSRFIQKGSYFHEGASKLNVENVINSGVDFTAIMFPDDYSAIGAAKYLKLYEKEKGIKISYTGFDGVEVTEILASTVTTIKQNTKLIGETAAKILLNEIEGKKTKKATYIPTIINEGETVVDLKGRK